MSPGRDLGGGRGEPGLPPTPADTGTRGCGRRSAGGYWVAVERRRWRPADEQGRNRLTRIAVDRGAQPQTGRVISAPLILDGPGRPGAGRSSCRCCAVMDVARFKDAGPAVSRICGHGSPIPISTQVRGILAIWAHRCAAAIGSAHRRAPRRRQSVPSGPDRPHGGHSSLTARARCAQHGPTSASSPNPAAPQLSIYPATPQPTAPARRFPDRHRHGRGHSARPGASLCGQGHSTPSGTAIPSPGARDAPSWKKVSPHTQNVPRHASELSVTRRTLVASNAARLPLSRGHRCPRMATDSTTTAATTFVRAALRTIVTIGDS